MVGGLPRLCWAEARPLARYLQSIFYAREAEFTIAAVLCEFTHGCVLRTAEPCRVSLGFGKCKLRLVCGMVARSLHEHKCQNQTPNRNYRVRICGPEGKGKPVVLRRESQASLLTI